MDQAVPNSRENRRSFLDGNYWFTDLPPGVIDHLADVSTIKILPDGTLFVTRDDIPPHLATIVRGGLRSMSSSVEGVEHVFSILTEGNIWGITSVMDGEKNPNEVYAYGETELLLIHRNDFKAALDRFPDLYDMVARLMSYRLRKAYTLIENLALNPIETRLIRTIVSMALAHREHIGVEAVDLKITQEELGRIIKSTRPTVNKHLKHLESLDLIQVEYGRIHVPDIDKLEDHAGGDVVYFR